MKHKELIVGLFAALAIAMLYLGFNYLKGTDFFSDQDRYFIQYKNVSELAVSNPVLVSGYAVGRVSRISLLPKQGNPVLVEIEVQGDVTLGEGAKGVLSSALLGSKSILLNLGDPSKPIQPGDTIAGELAKGMLETISETASPVAYDLQSTLKKFNTIIDDLSKTLEQVNPVLHKFQETPGKLNNLIDQSGQNITQVTTNIQELSDRLKLTLQQLDPTLSNLHVFSDSLRRTDVNAALQDARQTMTTMNDVMKRLQKGDNTAGKLLTQDSLYHNVNKVLNRIDSLTVHFSNNPRDFLKPLGRTPKQMERARRKEEERSRKKAGK